MLGACTYYELTANGTKTIVTGAGHLLKVVVNLPASGTMQIFDNTSAAVPSGGNPGIAGSSTAFSLPAAGTQLPFDCEFYRGLTIVIANMGSGGSVTVVFSKTPQPSD